jgi:hypothetical protein
VFSCFDFFELNYKIIVYKFYTKLIKTGSTVPMTDPIREKQEKIPKDLSNEVLRQERLDILSAQVLSIMKEISAPNVARLLQQITRSFASN